ncbi:hypothetical protein HYZ80_03445, partial [Candidatus Parcubacteria bacterium]|nr:hypothetical protein [Candidatus Parcubacteria bacterium]
TRQSGADNRILCIDDVVTTGGGDTHQHAMTWGALAASSGTALSTGTAASTANDLHTHTAPPTSSTTAITALPKYIQPVIGKANNVDDPVPTGLIAMFDGDPASPSWDLRSDSSDSFNDQMMRGAATYSGSSSGSNTHSHADFTSGNSGAPSATSSLKGNPANDKADGGHLHTETASFTANTDNQPQYFTVIYAEKIPAVDPQPNVTTISDTPDPVGVGSAVTFSVGWQDLDSATSWTSATSAAQWSERYSPTSLVFNNQMWVIGGYDDNVAGGCVATSECNDVWYSTTGTSWTQSTAAAQWSERYYHTSLVFNNQMWVIGGYDDNVSGGCVATFECNEVWYSTTGTSWTQST